jgi:hypothetical protein
MGFLALHRPPAGPGLWWTGRSLLPPPLSSASTCAIAAVSSRNGSESAGGGLQRGGLRGGDLVLGA